MKFMKIVLLSIIIIHAARFEKIIVTGIQHTSTSITTSISRRIFFFLSNCTFGAGNIRLSFYSPYSNQTEVELEIPGVISINSSLNTVFLIHGFLSDGTKDWVNDTVSALSKNQPRNIFVVDWRVGACSETVRFLNFQFYSSAASNTQVVGIYVARCIEILVNEYSVSLKDVWIIGHSLGAHVAGFAGKSLILHNGDKLGRITGLDPAGPLFRGLDSTKRLDKKDAVFVEVVHTSRLFGLQEAIGHIDLYFNGGEFQMSCLFSKPGCSHDRAVDYYLEAIANSNCNFMAKTWSRTQGNGNTSNNCSNYCAIAGPLAPSFSARGIFYIETNTGRPYCTGQPPKSSTLVEIPPDENPLDENIFDDLF